MPAIPPVAERRAALEARHPEWVPKTLDRFLADAASAFADRPLVITDDRTLTYADVDAWASRLAAGLIGLGVEPGDRVGLLLPNVLEFVPLKFAVARAGAVAIPFNFLYRRAELQHVLAQSGCKVLVAVPEFAGLDHAGTLATIRADLPALEHVVLLPDVAALEADPATVVDSPPPRAPDDLADILYTSGTTGSPKGVMVTHDAVQRTGYASALHRAFEDGRRILFSLPCYHMFGYVEGLIAAMHVGGAIVPRLTFDPADHFAAIERHRASEVLCVPTMTIALLEHPALREHDLSSVFALLSGAAPGPVWLWEKLAQDLGITDITTGYGMTETGGAMTLTLPEDPPERHAETVGRPKLAGVAGLDTGGLCEYRTAEVETGAHLPNGAEGELISTGPTHMLGFWDQPEESALALRGGWVHSGDLGYVGEDGYLRLTGRSKELYKSGGELVMPKEVEAVVAQLPGVSQAYAVGVTDERWGEIGCVWIVPEPGATIDPDAVIGHCREHLARFKVPKAVLLTTAETLPLTPTGKVQKFNLAKRARDELSGA